MEQSSDKNCAALCVLLGALAEAGLLEAEQVRDAVLKFLNSLDELIIDVPKAVSILCYSSFMFIFYFLHRCGKFSFYFCTIF